MSCNGSEGSSFAVWAPNAEYVSVIGDFNRWDNAANPLAPVGQSEVWEGFAFGATKGMRYKYYVVSRNSDHRAEKADPFSFLNEEPPKTASVVWTLDYAWGDHAWMTGRARRNAVDAPLAIYEVHPGSWVRVPEEGHRWLTYRELAEQLAGYVRKTGFTHVELLPIMEHPFYGSWGYQPTGFFAATSRYGTPQDLMYLVDYLHQNDIGVILDWVPFHFPYDNHALAYFDGTHLYEHPDPRRGFHPTWRSAVFDYSRPEVRSFLLSSAMFWLEKYHIDGLRVDAVSYMLCLDYCRKPGQWIPNQHGGRENLEAISFLRQFNDDIHKKVPGALTFAEEATAWPKVTGSTSNGGLGFDLKWDMGWMHDTLEYMHKNPHQRRQMLNRLTFRMIYAYSEHFALSLSHDEVVHLKGSLLGKMSGDLWQKFANLRLLYGYMYGMPGKKLLFMGGEFGQMREWNHNQSLDWHLLQQTSHAGVQKCISDLNRLYRKYAALHELDCLPDGFEWISCDDHSNSVLVFLRKSREEEDPLVLAVCNFQPAVHREYRIGVPKAGFWKEIFNTDAADYGGSGCGNLGGVQAQAIAWNSRPCSLRITVPPLAVVFFEGPSEGEPVP
jgi:1,4-alpha-glucan branching enzyme